jgi:HTH-type transcriptional regulator/antitoxin HigA
MRNDEVLHSDLAIPPGEYLLEVAREHGITQAELARRMRRPAQAINEIVKGRKAITPETALQLEQVLDVPAHIWTGLQAEYQLTRARQRRSDKERAGKEHSRRERLGETAPMVQEFFTTDDWDPEILQAVGRVAIHFQNLDYLVSLSVARAEGLTKSNKIQRVKALDELGLSVAERCEKILATFNKRFPDSENRKHLASVLQDVKRVNKEGNDIMHAFWGVDRSGKERIIRKHEDLGVDSAALRRLGDMILEIIERLHGITRAIPRS